MVEEIIIILNDSEPDNLLKLIEAEILPEYGALIDKVRLVDGSTLTSFKAKDWRSQQVLKLRIHAEVKTPWYGVLDAKNHWIRLATYDHLFGPGLKPRAVIGHYGPRSKQLRLTALNAMGLDSGVSDVVHLLFITPFFLRTQIVRDLVRYMAEEKKLPLEDFFALEGASEFSLYDAYLRRREIDQNALYSCTPIPISLTFWHERQALGQEFKDRAAVIDDQGVLMFALHRELFGHMPENFRNWVASVWLDRGLVANDSEAQAFLARPSIKPE